MAVKGCTVLQWISSLNSICIVVLLAIHLNVGFSVMEVLHSPRLTSNQNRDLCARCLCKKDAGTVKEVDCSYRNLTEIPSTLPASVTSLNMSGNTHLIIRNGSFRQVPNLETLDISNCSSHGLSITNETFSGLDNLKLLDISFNHMNFLYEQNMSSSIFSNVRALTTLKMYNNLDSKSVKNGSYPEVAFSSLERLEDLLMDGLPVDFGHVFSKMALLNSLRLSGNNCSMPQLTYSMFKNVRQVKILEIIGCEVKNISNDTFSVFRNLELLDLSCNDYLTFDSLSKAIEGLNRSNIRILKANSLYVPCIRGVQVEARHLAGLKYLPLEELHLDSNCIETVERSVIDNLPKTLNTISVRQNELKFGMYLIEIYKMKALRRVDLSYQYFPQVRKRRTPINRCYKKEILPQAISVPPNLQYVDFSHSKLGYPIKRLNISANRGKAINASSCMLVKWIGPVIGLEELEYLDLSDNGCNEVKQDFFDTLPGLKVLNISRNIINGDIEGDKTGRLFKNLSNLRHLEMVDLSLRHLPETMFQSLKSLKFLNLSDNILNDFEVNVGNLTYLRYLDLSYNQLSTLPESVTSSLNKIGTDAYHFDMSRITLNLTGNHIRCTCDNLNFLHWLAEAKHVATELTDCVLANRTKVLIKDNDSVKSILLFLDKQCASYWVLILGLTAMFVMLITVIVGVIVYRCRWRLRYWYYVVGKRYLSNRQGYMRVGTEERTFKFDTFVVYIDEDRDFVKSEMLPRLEEEERLRLIDGDRDFFGGESIPSLMTNAVHVSGVTILIISDRSIKDGEWMWGMRMALEESMRRGRRSYFAIFLNNVSYDIFRASRDLGELFRDEDAFMQYPTTKEPEAMAVFWARCIHKIREAGLTAGELEHSAIQ